MNKKLAFSMIELLIVIVILGIMAVAIILNPDVGKQTAKSEAEKIVAYIQKAMQRADKIHESFIIKKQSGVLCIKFGNNKHKPIPVSKGFTLDMNESSYDGQQVLTYSFTLNSFLPPSRELTVTRSDGQKYFIEIYVPGGRIRARAPN